MSDETNLDPTDLDGTVRADHELGDVDPSLEEAERDVRIDATEGDDLPASPPDMQPRASEREMAGLQGEETIDQRIMQEEPDPTSAYGAPDDEGGLDADTALGGDDVDAIAPEDDFMGAPSTTAEIGDGAVEPAAEEAALRVEDDADL